MKKSIILGIIGLCALTGCSLDSLVEEAEQAANEELQQAVSEAATAAAQEAAAAPTPAPAPRNTAPGSLNLVTATLPTMGHTMLLPEGFSRDRETEAGAGYSFDIGNMRRIMVSLESQGVPNARRARSLGPLVAGGLQVSEVTTLPNGHHLVLFNTRESDNMQAVAVFTATHYVKCMGPEPYLAELRRMCESLAPISS